MENTHKALIVTGGHEFERDAFFDMFNSFSDIDYEEIVQPEANQQLTSPFFYGFDAIIFYDMVQDITEAQQKSFIKLLQRGKGIIFLHHALASYREWAEYERITGGRFYLDLKPDVKNEEDYLISTYQHNVNIPVKIVDKNHPITHGLNDFDIHDEIYGNFKVLPVVQPLLSTSHPGSGEIIGWTHFYGNSPIVTIQPGHDHHAYNNPNYRRLIRQAIEWATATAQTITKKVEGYDEKACRQAKVRR
ncbi:MAG: ThuA domain-containing protein [Anaerolineae bacterium]|nr:ThuA domain-containing protein [Anaerolineae bacterium]